MPKAVDCYPFPCVDDAGFLYQQKDLKQIKEELTKNVSNICDWFVDSRLRVHFR